MESSGLVLEGDDHPVRIEDEPAAAAVVFGDRLELAQRYVAALASGGVLRGLIGPREPARLWTRHLLNSAVTQRLIPPGSAVVDVGSGAGLPGIPLAIARPDLSVALVEPLERRTAFLLEIVEQLGLANCRVLRGRADEVVGECGHADVVTSRAVAPLLKLAGWCAPLLRIGGDMLALKGSSASEEIARDGAGVASAGIVDLAVVSVGDDLLDPPTLVVRGRRVATGRDRRGHRKR